MSTVSWQRMRVLRFVFWVWWCLGRVGVFHLRVFLFVKRTPFRVFVFKLGFVRVVLWVCWFTCFCSFSWDVTFFLFPLTNPVSFYALSRRFYPSTIWWGFPSFPSMFRATWTFIQTFCVSFTSLCRTVWVVLSSRESFDH